MSLVTLMTESQHPEFAAQCRDLQVRFGALVREGAALEAARGEAMYAGRQLQPPMTFRELADCFEVTVGAVQARVEKEKARR